MTLLPATAAFVAALILQDCVLLSTGALLSVRAFYCSMDRAAPITAIGAALRCLGAGLTLPLMGMALTVVSITALLGWWTPSPRFSAWAVLVVVLTVGVSVVLPLIDGSTGVRGMIIDVLTMVALIEVIDIRNSGIGAVACWALLASGAIVLALSWHLAHTSANTLLEQARW